VSDEAGIESALAAWQIATPATIERLGGGFNSRTWRIACGDREFVAKLVSHNTTFEAGLLVAEQLERAGFRAGGPLRTRSGTLTVPLADESLALLRFAPGEPIDPTRPDDLRIWGDTLAQLHLVQQQVPMIPEGLPRWPWAWLDPTMAYLGVEPWVRPMVERALQQVRALEAARPFTLGIVHGDGAPVLVDPASGTRSVIDWGAAMYGPLLYDVASAYWLFQFKDAGDPADFAPFLDAYRDRAPLPADELDGLEFFVRLRCAVQALYFAWRIADDVHIGLADPAENRRGLEDAHRAWRHLGQPSVTPRVVSGR
jgi:Ser/Thr protein kinase RdoA (MazF antagonist)